MFVRQKESEHKLNGVCKDSWRSKIYKVEGHLLAQAQQKETEGALTFFAD